MPEAFWKELCMGFFSDLFFGKARKHQNGSSGICNDPVVTAYTQFTKEVDFQELEKQIFELDNKLKALQSGQGASSLPWLIHKFDFP